VLVEGDLFRMYFVARGPTFRAPENVRTAHGANIFHKSIGYAESKDGIHWSLPLDEPVISPRGTQVDPYEYMIAKPHVVRERWGYRMWVSTYGTAYRIKSLVSQNGLEWEWLPSGPDGELGVGASGSFDDSQRSYPCVVKHGPEYRMWYTGNGFGATGMGYATGVLVDGCD
jgi:hypothetical protein